MKTDWLFVISGSDTDGSIVSIIRNKSVDDMKKYIAEKVVELSKSINCFDNGTDWEDDIEERFKDGELVSLYGYGVYAEGHNDYEAHILSKVEVIK